MLADARDRFIKNIFLWKLLSLFYWIFKILFVDFFLSGLHLVFKTKSNILKMLISNKAFT